MQHAVVGACKNRRHPAIVGSTKLCITTARVPQGGRCGIRHARVDDVAQQLTAGAKQAAALLAAVTTQVIEPLLAVAIRRCAGRGFVEVPLKAGTNVCPCKTGGGCRAAMAHVNLAVSGREQLQPGSRTPVWRCADLDVAPPIRGDGLGSHVARPGAGVKLSGIELVGRCGCLNVRLRATACNTKRSRRGAVENIVESFQNAACIALQVIGGCITIRPLPDALVHLAVLVLVRVWGAAQVVIGVAGRVSGVGFKAAVLGGHEKLVALASRCKISRPTIFVHVKNEGLDTQPRALLVRLISPARTANVIGVRPVGITHDLAAIRRPGRECITVRTAFVGKHLRVEIFKIGHILVRGRRDIAPVAIVGANVPDHNNIALQACIVVVF